MRMFQQHAKDLYNRTRWNVSVSGIDNRPARSNQLILIDILESQRFIVGQECAVRFKSLNFARKRWEIELGVVLGR